MVQRFIRCPGCYGRVTRTDDGSDEHAVEMHRLSGYCRAAVAPKERKPPKKTDVHLNDLLGGP